MNVSMLVLVPLLVLAVVAVFAFAGCTLLVPLQDHTAVAQPPSQQPPPPNQQPPPPTAPPSPTPPATTPKSPTVYPDLIKTEIGKSLRSYWRLSEAPGALQATDSDPISPKDLTYHSVTLGVDGVLRLGSAPMDQAASFNGANAYAETAYDTLLNPPYNFTIEAWIRPEPTAPGTASAVVSSYDVAARRGFVLEVVQVSATAMKAQVRIGEGNQFRTLAVDLGDGTANDGWRYVVVTLQGTTPPRTLTLHVNAGNAQFIDTIPNATNTVDMNYKYAPQSTGPPFRIGAGRDETVATAVAGRFFNGRIDEVALYDQPLTLATMKQHFDAGTTK